MSSQVRRGVPEMRLFFVWSGWRSVIFSSFVSVGGHSYAWLGIVKRVEIVGESETEKVLVSRICVGVLSVLGGWLWNCKTYCRYLSILISGWYVRFGLRLRATE